MANPEYNINKTEEAGFITERAPKYGMSMSQEMGVKTTFTPNKKKKLRKESDSKDLRPENGMSLEDLVGK